MNEIAISMAKTDEECLDIHLFLCIVSAPHLPVPFDPNDSISGIIDVRDNGYIVVAKSGPHIVGTIGLISMRWWYNTKKEFLTNRWFFIYPNLKHKGVGKMLEDEALLIGSTLDVPVLIVSHTKQRNKSRPYFAREHELK